MFSAAGAPGVTRDETPHNTLPAQSLPELELLNNGTESKATKPNLSQNPRSKDRQIWASPKRAPDPGGEHDREPRPKESYHAKREGGFALLPSGKRSTKP
jgi:hypothetical protein